MDKEKIDEVKQKLLEINETISSLDPEIRAAAFNILTPYYFDKIAPKKPAKELKKEESIKEDHTEKGDMGAFFGAHDHKQPKNNVNLVAAWLYQQHGVFPITSKIIKEIANATGLIVPNRPDNTMRQAKKKGRSFFNKQGSGWQLTVSGQTFIRETYGVQKGNKPLND
jgi:hypothetical protein